MHCTKCGAELNPNAKFCTTCGTPVDNATPAAPAAAPSEQYAPPAQPAAQPAKAEGSKINMNEIKEQLIQTASPILNAIKSIWANKKIRLGIIIGVALLVVLGIGGLILGNTGYKTALDNYVAVMNGNAKKVEKLMPKEYWEYLEEEDGQELDDIIDDFEDDYKDLVDEWEDEYGKNPKVSYEIEEAEKMDKDDVEDMAEALEEKYSFIDDKDVKQAYEVEIELTIKGRKDDDSDDMDVLCVKIGSGWYLISKYGSGDSAYYSFLGTSLM